VAAGALVGSIVHAAGFDVASWRLGLLAVGSGAVAMPLAREARRRVYQLGFRYLFDWGLIYGTTLMATIVLLDRVL
jgi:hypothetical protein